jgi:methyl-accepting chemotaxis protein
MTQVSPKTNLQEDTVIQSDPELPRSPNRFAAEQLREKMRGLVEPPRSGGVSWWQGLSIRVKTTALAVVLGALPVLIVGGTSAYVANQVIRAEVVTRQDTLPGPTPAASTPLASQRTLVLTLLLGTGATALVVGLIAAVVMNRAMRPILAATEAVAKIGMGELDTRLDVHGRDEIAVLGKNINRMVIQLQGAVAAQTSETAQERILMEAKGSNALYPTDLQIVYDHTLETARQLLQLDRMVVYRFGETTDAVMAESVALGYPSAMQMQMSDVMQMNDVCIPAATREFYRSGKVMVVANVVEAGLHSEHLKLLSALDVRALLVAPLIAGDRLFGLLIAHDCSAARPWQGEDIEFLKRLGQELGLTTYRVTLLEEAERLAIEQQKRKEFLETRVLSLLQEVAPLGQGDLTTRVRVTADEIGTIADFYNAMVDSLRTIVLQVKEAADQVTETTQVNQAAIQMLSTNALYQAEEIAQALQSIEDLAMSAQAVDVNAIEAEQVIQQAGQTVKEGDAAMNSTVEGIQAIRATVAEAARKVKHLGESSQKISTVVDLISSLASQTHMLALNASIEAGRASEDNRSFVIVAEEVRALARQSAQATEDIRKLIDSIQTETNEVIIAMEAGTEQVVKGTQLVDVTRRSLTKISTASEQVSQLVKAITQATSMQSQTAEVITQTIQKVNAIAHQTSTEANQVSDSFEELQQVAQTLQLGVSQFKVL